MTAGDARLARVDAIFAETIRVHEQVRQACGPALLETVDALVNTFARGGRALVFGNGGSAADAQHFACELVGRFQRERRAAAAIALTTDTSIVTAIANDYGFERVFARQIEAWGRSGDVAVGITTSGSSANVRAGLETARARGLRTIVMTGRTGASVASMADILVTVGSDLTARVQEAQRTQMHIICELVEAQLADGTGEGHA
jgi:D-sedoheptulose 7-phosphate isomerase